MDAGVLVRLPQIQFSISDGGAPLAYGINGQFQISPSSSVGQQGVPHGDTDSSGDDTSVSDVPDVPDESTALQGTTPSQPIHPPESFAPSFKATPSPTRVPKSPLTTTGGVKELFSNELPTLSPRISVSLFGISTATQGVSTISFRPFSSSNSFSQSESVSGSSTSPLSYICPSYPGSPCSISTTEGTPTATSAAQLITIAPAVPARISSFGVKSSSWYLAVIFGTIGGLALLIFLITFIVVIFRKVKRRRMARNIDVPWAATPDDEEQGRLFFGPRDLSFRSVNAATGQQENLAHGRLRTSDRIVNESGYSLYNHPIPGSRLFSDETLPPKSERLSLGHRFHPTSLNTLRFLPSHLIDEELADRAIQEDGAYSFSGRPIGLRKRSRGHLDEDNPYINSPSESLTPLKDEHNPTSAPKHQPLIDRLRNLGNQDKSGSWDRLPTPGRDQTEKDDREPWASSFKASLFNALNSLASGLKTDSYGENGLDGDRLTQAPTRHRPSIRRNSMEPFPRSASSKSPAWILHERHDGTGTVQFLPRLEKQSDSFQNTPTPGRLLSFVRGKAPPTYNDEKGEFRRTERLIYPRALFPPATAMVHPHRNPSLTQRNPISRDSSVYSTSSLDTLKCDLPVSSLEGLAGIPVLNQHRSPRIVDLDVVVLEPNFLSLHGHSITR